MQVTRTTTSAPVQAAGKLCMGHSLATLDTSTSGSSLLAFSTDEGLAGDWANVQRDRANDPQGEDERDSSRKTFLASWLLAFAGDVKNVQHGLADDPDRMEERDASLVIKTPVLATFCGGWMTCCGTARSRRLLRRAVTTSSCGRGLFLLLPMDLRIGGGTVRETVKTNAGDVGELVCLMGEGNKAKPPLSVEPVRACFGEGKDATAVEPVGVSGCSGEGVNMKPPLAVGPVGVVGFLGEVTNVSQIGRAHV